MQYSFGEGLRLAFLCFYNSFLSLFPILEKAQGMFCVFVGLCFKKMFLSKKVSEHHIDNSSVNTCPQDSAARGVVRLILDLDGEMIRKADPHTGLFQLFYLFKSILSRQISFSLAVTTVSPVDMDVVTEIIKESPSGQTPGLWVGCALFVGLAVFGGGCFLYNLITGGANDVSQSGGANENPPMAAEVDIMSEFAERLDELTRNLQMADEYKRHFKIWPQVLKGTSQDCTDLTNLMADNPQH